MRLTVTRQNLQRGLAAVTASIPGKSTLPVLSNVLIASREGSVWMTATDLDVSIRVSIPAEVSQPGALTAPGRKLLELTRELPDEPVSLGVRGHQLEVECGNSRFKLNGLPEEEFPNVPAVDFEEGWSVSEESLRRLIRSTAFAVSTEESRPILNGVYWVLAADKMTMVATNGHRLARMSAAAAHGRAAQEDGADEVVGGIKEEFIVPPAALSHVERLFDGAGEITLGRGGNHLGFRTENQEVYTRLIDGKYPNYKQVVPRDNDKIARVDRDTLGAAVRRMAVLASDQTRRIKLTFGDDRVHLDVMTPDLGEAHDEQDVEYAGDELRIAFNAAYILEVLRHMPDGEVRVAFKSPERAATFEPTDPELDYLCLVMPLRLVD